MDRISVTLQIVQMARSLGDCDSNVLGMAGEVLAEERLGMQKVPKQSKEIDGYISVKGVLRSVQIKTFSSGRIAKYAGRAKFRVASGKNPERLVVILVLTKEGTYEILFDGNPATVGKIESIKGVARRGIRLRDLYEGRESELHHVVERCKRDAYL